MEINNKNIGILISMMMKESRKIRDMINEYKTKIKNDHTMNLSLNESKSLFENLKSLFNNQKQIKKYTQKLFISLLKRKKEKLSIIDKENNKEIKNDIYTNNESNIPEITRIEIIKREDSEIKRNDTQDSLDTILTFNDIFEDMKINDNRSMLNKIKIKEEKLIELWKKENNKYK